MIVAGVFAHALSCLLSVLVAFSAVLLGMNVG